MTKEEIKNQLKDLENTILGSDLSDFRLFILQHYYKEYESGSFIIDNSIHYNYWLDIANLLLELRLDIEYYCGDSNDSESLLIRVFTCEVKVHEKLIHYSSQKTLKKIGYDIKKGPFVIAKPTLFNPHYDKKTFKEIIEKAQKNGLFEENYRKITQVLRFDNEDFIHWKLQKKDLIVFTYLLSKLGIISKASDKELAGYTSACFLVENQQPRASSLAVILAEEKKVYIGEKVTAVFKDYSLNFPEG